MSQKSQVPRGQRTSGRSGRVSAIDNPQSSQSCKEKRPEPEHEPSQSNGRGQQSGTSETGTTHSMPTAPSSRAAKSALLDNPPWESLKPKTKTNLKTTESVKARSTPKKTAHKQIVPDTASRRVTDDRSEKRKRSGSAIEVHQPRNKKLKSAPVTTPKPGQATRRSVPRAPSIDIDGSDEDVDGNYNDSGDDDADKISQGSVDEETSSAGEKEVSPDLLKAEEAKIVSKMRTETRPAQTPQSSKSELPAASSRSSTPASYAAGPPTSDFDIDNVPDEPEDDSSQPDKQPQQKTHRELKLEQERPIIHAAPHKQPPNNARHSVNPVKEEKNANTPATLNSNDDKPWKTRTELKIYMRSKRTAAIGLRDQNPDMKKVIHSSYEFGKLALVVGDPQAMIEMPNGDILKMSSLFSTRGLEDIALTALIKAAESNGYDGAHDIAHRLEEGSVQLYIEPLQDYVAHRLALYRNSFKKCITLIAPGILGLPTNSYQHNNNLLNNNSFIYPWSQENGFDTSKPFHNPVIAKSVETTFFTPGSQYNSLGLDFAGRLASSSDAQPGQREVSIFMVALASVGVSSVIQDTLLCRSTDFAGPHLDSLFKKLVVILLNLRRSKPVTYHKIMHGIYTSAVGEKPLNLTSSDLTAEEILGEINWDLIQDE